MSPQHELLNTYRQLAGLLEDQGKAQEALDAYAKCVALLQQMVSDGPDAKEQLQALLDCHRRMGSLHAGLGQAQQAVEALQSGLAVAERLASLGSSPAPTQEAAPQQPPAVALPPTPAESGRFADRFPKYWAWGHSGTFGCWRSSQLSLEDAQRAADARAAEMEAVYRQNGAFEQKYFYPDRPLREPLIELVGDAVVSRNAYGCLVLNTPNALFVDIDFPPYEEPGLLKSLFGGNDQPKRDAHTELHQRLTLERVAQWTADHPGWGWRTYRTFAGIRLLATHALFEPDSPQTQSTFKELASDPLYATLCRIQGCFRARVSPKPWRVGLKAPERRWPWESPDEEERFNRWLARYERLGADYASCWLLGTYGEEAVHPDLATLVEYHDAATHADTERPLA